LPLMENRQRRSIWTTPNSGEGSWKASYNP
jgi:hypothetical protein